MSARVTVCAMVAALVLGCLPAQAANLTGPWSFVFETPNGSRTVKAAFTLEGDKVVGTMDGAAVSGTGTGGKLEMSFPYTPPELGSGGTLVIKGQYENEAITGTWAFDPYGGTFKAARPPVTDMKGPWTITGDVMGNPVNATCTFAQDAGVLTGNCAVPTAATPPAVKGTSTADGVTFEFPVTHEGQDYTLVFKGAPADGADLKGVIEVAGVSGTFTGRRGAAEAVPSAAPAKQ